MGAARPGEAGKIRYINYGYWIGLSGGTRLATQRGDTIVLEGHMRLTWMALAGERVGGIDALVGICADDALRRWDEGMN